MGGREGGGKRGKKERKVKGRGDKEMKERKRQRYCLSVKQLL